MKNDEVIFRVSFMNLPIYHYVVKVLIEMSIKKKKYSTMIANLQILL